MRNIAVVVSFRFRRKQHLIRPVGSGGVVLRHLPLDSTGAPGRWSSAGPGKFAQPRKPPDPGSGQLRLQGRSGFCRRVNTVRECVPGRKRDAGVRFVSMNYKAQRYTARVILIM